MWNVIPVVAITKLMVSIATRQCTGWLHPTCWWEDPVWRAGRDLPRRDLGDYLWRQVDLQGSWRHLSYVRRNEVLPLSLIFLKPFHLQHSEKIQSPYFNLSFSLSFSISFIEIISISLSFSEQRNKLHEMNVEFLYVTCCTFFKMQILWCLPYKENWRIYCD